MKKTVWDKHPAAESLKKIKEEEVTVTLTLGQIDALVSAGQFTMERLNPRDTNEINELAGALQKLDEAVNL